MKHKKTRGELKRACTPLRAMPEKKPPNTFNIPPTRTYTQQASQESGVSYLLSFAFLLFVAASLSSTFSYGQVPAIIGCDFNTASMVFAITFAYGTLACIIFIARPAADSPEATEAWGRAIRFVAHWMWNLMGAVIVIGFLMVPIGRVFARTTGHYVEVVGDWQPVFHRWRDYGSDSFITPERGNAPILLDLLTQIRLKVLDDSEDDPLATRLKINSLRVDHTTDTPVLHYAQARVRKTLFGKRVLVGIDYVPFEKLPVPVQQKALDELARKSRDDVWRFAERHPEHTGMAGLALQHEDARMLKQVKDVEEFQRRKVRKIYGY